MNEVPQQISLTEAKLGDNVTLTCAIFGSDPRLFYWFKLNFGYMVQTVAKGSFGQISHQFNNSRFSATKVGNVLSLIIRNVSKEDEAMYFCQAGSSFSVSFINGTILAVNDPKTQHKFVTVKIIPDHLGDTIAVQCSLLSKNKNDPDQCPDEDKVHWFKGASESHPGIIYYGSIRNKEDGRCDYSLSKTRTHSSDAGTYYCAVITCGEILFGEGTKVDIRKKWDPVVIVLGMLLALCVIVIFFLLCFVFLTLECTDMEHRDPSFFFTTSRI
uniref:Ig-like domain-containing protein n=1 Tax=Oreochromis niloticus TaxID=8128 RepID=A0A669F3W1_ORENI